MPNPNDRSMPIFPTRSTNLDTCAGTYSSFSGIGPPFSSWLRHLRLNSIVIQNSTTRLAFQRHLSKETRVPLASPTSLTRAASCLVRPDKEGESLPSGLCLYKAILYRPSS